MPSKHAIQKERERMCLGKEQHKTYLAAEYVLQNMTGIEPAHLANLEIYRCKFCKDFHIGHQKGTAPKTNPKRTYSKKKTK